RPLPSNRLGASVFMSSGQFLTAEGIRFSISRTSARFTRSSMWARVRSWAEVEMRLWNRRSSRYLGIGQYYGSLDSSSLLLVQLHPVRNQLGSGTLHYKFELYYKDWSSSHCDAASHGNLLGAELSTDRGKTCKGLWSGFVWAN